MKKVKKESNIAPQTNNSTPKNKRSKGKLTPSEVRKNTFMVPKVDSEGQGEELHWMANAAYNQSN